MHLWFKRVSTFTTSLCIVYGFNAILSTDIIIKRLRKKTDAIMETDIRSNNKIYICPNVVFIVLLV